LRLNNHNEKITKECGALTTIVLYVTLIIVIHPLSAFMDANYIRPKNWRQDIWELDPENLDNNGLQNEDLMGKK
jgi:hypothetical protein